MTPDHHYHHHHHHHPRPPLPVTYQTRGISMVVWPMTSQSRGMFWSMTFQTLPALHPAPHPAQPQLLFLFYDVVFIVVFYCCFFVFCLLFCVCWCCLFVVCFLNLFLWCFIFCCFWLLFCVLWILILFVGFSFDFFRWHFYFSICLICLFGGCAGWGGGGVRLLRSKDNIRHQNPQGSFPFLRVCYNP